MKRLYRVFITSAISCLLVFSGCREIEITTTVKSNGNLERKIVAVGDSSGVGKSSYPINYYSTWSIEKDVNPDNDKEMIWSFSKEYKDANALNKDNAPKDSILYITYETNLEKKFRWIYTYYSYRETIKELGPMLIFPDEESMSIYQAKRDSGLNAEKWEDELLFESFFQTLLKYVVKHPINGLSPEILESKRKELYLNLEEIDDDIWDKLDEHLLTSCQKVFNLQSTEPLQPVVDEYWPKLKKYLNYIERAIGEDFKNNVEMPGQVIDTNAEKVEGNVVHWEFSSDDFEVDDYVMWVESRKMNLMSTIFTAIVLLGIIAALYYLTLWEKIQNRKNPNPSQFILNKWISIVLLVIGMLVLTFGIILTITMWNWGIIGLEMTSLRDRILFVFIDVVGFLMMLIGGIHLLRLRRR